MQPLLIDKCVFGMRMERLFLLWSSFSEAKNQLHSYRTTLITPSASVKQGPKVKMKTTDTKEDTSIHVYESRKNGLGKDQILYMHLTVPLFFISFPFGLTLLLYPSNSRSDPFIWAWSCPRFLPAEREFFLPSLPVWESGSVFLEAILIVTDAVYIKLNWIKSGFCGRTLTPKLLQVKSSG